MLIRQAAFDGSEKMLKGALHCHTTRSDGRGDPDAVMRMHAENGYDFMAITDHRRYNRETYAPETNITVIPGMEFDNTFEKGNGFRCFHTVCIGPANEDNRFEHEQRFESGTAKNQEEYQSYLDWLHENGQMTVYCHPQWSSTPARYFEKQQGNFAMEIWNSGCAIEDHMDMNAAYWDELLGQGIRIFGVATDDGHQMYHHCNGWVMVNSENSVEAILTALKEGAFYSSCGPVIKDFYVEDGVAHITCSEVSHIELISDRHPTKMISGENLTEAEASLDGGWTGGYDYIRVSVVDSEGRRAWTNPIWLK